MVRSLRLSQSLILVIRPNPAHVLKSISEFDLTIEHDSTLSRHTCGLPDPDPCILSFYKLNQTR